jgi:hypothetical protein
MERSLWSLEADVDVNRDKTVQRLELWLDPGTGKYGRTPRRPPPASSDNVSSPLLVTADCRLWSGMVAEYLTEEAKFVASACFAGINSSSGVRRRNISEDWCM